MDKQVIAFLRSNSLLVEKDAATVDSSDKAPAPVRPPDCSWVGLDSVCVAFLCAMTYRNYSGELFDVSLARYPVSKHIHREVVQYRNVTCDPADVVSSAKPLSNHSSQQPQPSRITKSHQLHNTKHLCVHL